MRWDLNAILICISLISKDIQQFLSFVLVIFTYFIENYIHMLG